ncbi:nuclear transport factor 2 family protein [Chitinimonas naiadis]
MVAVSGPGTRKEGGLSVHAEILDLLEVYFDGIHTGDVAALRSVFHPQAALFGEVRGATSCRPLGAYLDAVANRDSPASLGQTRFMQVLSIEVAGETAMAKVRCLIFDFNYLDFLSLIRQEGRWLIANKLYTHIA